MWGLFNSIISIPVLIPIISHLWIEKVGYDFDEIQSTPLYQMEEIPHTYSALLGNSQADNILHEYNPLLNSSSWDSYEWVNTVYFPLIYPEILDYLPVELSWLESKTFFSKHEKKVFDRDHLVLVFRAENEKAVLWYYKNQKLKLATYVSLWNSHNERTESWIYRLYHREIDHRSTMYDDDPMPYALQYTWAYYLHYWESDWTDLSHGCIRVPWLYQKWLYENLPWDWETTIIVHRPYEITLRKE